MKNKLVIIATLFVVSIISSACSQKMKHKVGLTTSGPNEFEVSKNKLLEMPPHFELDEIQRSNPQTK